MCARAVSPAAARLSREREVHLLVLVHGMWGAPEHLLSLKSTIQDMYPSSDDPGGVDLEVLVAESNKSSRTYDGAIWGGERLLVEIQRRVECLEATGRSRVTRFSITGYSFGGLLARYVVGALYHAKFFEKVKPMNFNTFATPHLGLPRYPNLLSSIFATLGPIMLSRTGQQFYALDKWDGAKGGPLLSQMSHKDSVFYIGLSQFQNITIYANSIDDTTVPFLTAAIESEDPFLRHQVNGIEIRLDDKYSPLIESFRFPKEPTLPKVLPPPMLSLAYIRSLSKRHLFVPPRLQFSLPVKLLALLLLPITFLIAFAYLFGRLLLESNSSYARVKILEADQFRVQSTRALFREAREDLERVVDYLTQPDDQLMASWDSHSWRLWPTKPYLTPVQLKMADSLNSIPHLIKKFAYIEGVINSHAVIVARDRKDHPFQEIGMGVIRHWADHFVV